MSAVMQPYIPPSWFHPIGIKKILAKLMPKLPDVSGCLFITLTIDRNYFAGPESAFDYTRDQIRRMFHKLRNGVEWNSKTILLDVPYFVKVEFHEDGWPHFHIIFLTRRRLPAALLRKLWPHGRTNIKRIRNKRFHYLLKYVTKGGKIPQWVLNRQRIRIVQASHGFYKESNTKDVQESVKEYSVAQRKVFKTIGERLRHWERMVLLEREDGTRTTALLPIPYHEFIGKHVLTFAQAGLYLGNQIIKLNNKTIEIWKREIMKLNADCSLEESLYQVRLALSQERTAQAVP